MFKGKILGYKILKRPQKKIFSIELTKKHFTNEKKSYRIAQTTKRCEEIHAFQRHRIT